MIEQSDPYLDEPRLCPVHGCEIESDGYCDACWAAHYEDRLSEEGDPDDAEEERGERDCRRLTRHERLQAAADAGIDTWEEYRGER